MDSKKAGMRKGKKAAWATLLGTAMVLAILVSLGASRNAKSSAVRVGASVETLRAPEASGVAADAGRDGMLDLQLD